MTSLPKAFDPKLVEEKWYSFWEKEGFFSADAESKKEPFCIVLPPPNVTGVLHMGHALVDTLQDVLIRWKRMEGLETLWIPGTDHAGIATQMVVERQLFAKTGKRRKDFSREEFLEHIWRWKDQSEKQILGQLKKLGCSCDWSRLRFTMDAGCNRAVRTCFKKMFDEGLIYRGDYLVNWDPALQTALSDDEVEHEERDSFLWHIRYPLANGKGELTIVTTRPETLLGDTAVAVHPDDARYQKLVGEKVQLPLMHRTIPIIADTSVDPTFGTGAVKITPAHDFADFEMGQRHHLPAINILTPEGKINEAGKGFAGLTVEEAREAIVRELKKHHFLEKVEPYKLRVGLSYRSKAILQPYLSKQWFIRMAPFKERLIAAVKEKRVQLIPSHWEETYFHWIERLRDWCISRQIWWGHQIPIWYHRKNSEQMICWSGEGAPPEVARDPESWVQDPDVLDTWFSSALWPLSTLGWPEKTAELQTFYPTATLITGHDILFFWVARMILMGEYLQGEIPFRQTFLHGLIYGKSYWKANKEGGIAYLSSEEKKKYDLGAPLPSDVETRWEKMSKSKGNIIDPLEISAEYGTDALRIALCSSTTFARQIDLDRRRFEEFKNFANKVWNGARFVFLNIEGLSSAEFVKGLDFSLFALEDRWMLSLLNRTIGELRQYLTDYAFDRLALRSYEFFWNDFCSIYVELAKPILFGKRGNPSLKINQQKLLVVILLNALRLLHPITPFITEELFSLLKGLLPPLSMKVEPKDLYTKEALQALSAPACIVAPYPKVLQPKDIDSAAEADFAMLLEMVRVIRNIRTEMQIPPSEKTDLFLFALPNSREEALVRKHAEILLSLTPTASMTFSQKEPAFFGATGMVGSLKLSIPLPASLKMKEKARLEKEREKLEKLCESTRGKLAHPEFRSKAPPSVVQKLEQTLIQAEKELREILEKLR